MRRGAVRVLVGARRARVATGQVWLRCCTAGAARLGGQGAVEHDGPSGHAVHCSAKPRPSTLLKVPSWHGSAADAPSPQYEPATHSTHAVAPASAWYLPTAHLAHGPAAAVAAPCPDCTALASSLPLKGAGWTVDAVFFAVIERLSATNVPFAWRPDGHGKAADAPSMQYEPATLDAVAPASS